MPACCSAATADPLPSAWPTAGTLWSVESGAARPWVSQRGNAPVDSARLTPHAPAAAAGPGDHRRRAHPSRGEVQRLVNCLDRVTWCVHVVVVVVGWVCVGRSAWVCWVVGWGGRGAARQEWGWVCQERVSTDAGNRRAAGGSTRAGRGRTSPAWRSGAAARQQGPAEHWPPLSVIGARLRPAACRRPSCRTGCTLTRTALWCRTWGSSCCEEWAGCGARAPESACQQAHPHWLTHT